MRFRLPLLFIVILAAAPHSEAIVIRDDVGDSGAQALAALPAYDSVGMLNRFGDITSGVLINPLLVLTAKHLVVPDEPAGPPAPDNVFRPTSSFIFTIGGFDYTSAGYTKSGVDDLAIIQLALPVTNVTPALLYTGSAEVGKLATMVGFGQGGVGTTGGSGARGTKRAATNVIDYADITRVLYSDFDNPDGLENTLLTTYGIPSSATPTTSEGVIAWGDSGGGTFATISSLNYLIGIHYGVSFDEDGINYNYGDINVDTRVSTASSFIQSVVPEPSSIACLALGLAVLGARRNRKG